MNTLIDEYETAYCVNKFSRGTKIGSGVVRSYDLEAGFDNVVDTDGVGDGD